MLGDRSHFVNVSAVHRILYFALSTCSVCVCKPLAEDMEGEEEEGGGGGEREAREVDSPPVEIKDEERVEIFASRQRLSENQ